MDYDLDIQEEAPTGDQLKSILQYAGPGKAGTIVQGARDLTDAMEKVKRDGGLFNRPLVCCLKLKIAVHLLMMDTGCRLAPRQSGRWR